MKTLLHNETIEGKIYLIRGHKVMLDRDLAELYGVSTKRLNQQVTRNMKRFPSDFMFQLTPEEQESLRLQIATSNRGRGGRRYQPYAFTEQGVAMLSSVLNSERAIQVNIAIMRAFVNIRSFLANHQELAKKLKELESKVSVLGTEVQLIFEAIKKLMAPPDKSTKRIGFMKK